MPEMEPADDVLNKLKIKEEEMEALIEESKKRAASIKEDAIRKAIEIKDSAIKGLETELASIAVRERARTAEEVKAIEERAAEEAEDLRSLGLGRKSEAVEAVVRFLLEGIGDKGDEKNSDDRAQG